MAGGPRFLLLRDQLSDKGVRRGSGRAGDLAEQRWDLSPQRFQVGQKELGKECLSQDYGRDPTLEA
jgi:hypothetical protein